jgi:hypothetical protein
MGRHRRSSIARACALAATAAAVIVLAIDFANPVPRLNVPAICLVVVAVGAWLAWQNIHTREIVAAGAVANRRAREEHAEQRLRGLMSPADRDR